jgi:hypothetical protein
VFEALIRDRDNQYLMLDTTLVRAFDHGGSGDDVVDVPAGQYEAD